MVWQLARLLAAGLSLFFIAPCALAQDSGGETQLAQSSLKGGRLSHAARIDEVNQNTVTIITGNPNGTQLIIGYDLSVVLDDGNNLRVLPVVGTGSQGNIRDVLYLRGVDMGITQTNILAEAKRSGIYGPGMENRIAYITTLFNSEMHVLAGPGIEKLEDLNGKKVNLSTKGSGSQAASRQVFDALGIKIEEVNMGHSDAYLKIKSGEIAATVAASAKPGAAFQKFKLEPGMKLLPVPYTEALEEDFLPTTITHKDYPNLLKEGESVDTIAFSLVLIAYNWPRNTERYRRLAKFVDAFFTKFEELKKPPRHEKWKDVNLAAPFKGWKRFPAAQEWLDRHPVGAPTSKSVPSATPPAAPAVDPALARVQAARAAPNDPAEQERLFREFLEWSRSQGKKQ
ncbi:MAG TPA: TAXI family TRAP transporter solute-binding subunit [Hyphomicrobiaceae bacterium]|nr:TAXI family TRAP transporter solute-binding subunit [Hyphomicrobiaceae bacterium]